MKRLSLVAASLLLASSAQAAFIQCNPGQADVVINAVGASATFTCNPGAGGDLGSGDDNLAGDGFNVTGIRLRVSSIFQENNGNPGQTYTVAYSNANSGGYINPANGSATGVADANRQVAALYNSIGGFFAVGPVDFLSAFTITVTGGPGTNPLPFNASASAFYEVTAVRPGVVPEPATLGLLGLGLLGTWVGAKRRRKIA